MIATLRNTIIVVTVITFITFVALFGRLPALRKTPIGFLHRLLCIHIPSNLRRLDARLTGGRVTSALAGLGHYLMKEKNPVVLILFLALLSGSIYVFLRSTHFLLSFQQILPLPLLITAPYCFTYLCVASKADYITPNEHPRQLHQYPYDHVLYRPNHTCRTCGFDKPARSKHCSLCGVCVAKADHHCPWVNNCLGRNNYRWFLLLLLSIVILEIYGAYLAWSVLSPSFANLDRTLGWTSKVYWEQWGSAFARAMTVGGLSVAGVGLLAFTTTPLPFALLCYHIYLVWAGMTTNESAKWADWRDDMKDGVVYRAKRTVILQKERERKQRTTTAAQVGDENKTLLPVGESEDEPNCPWPVKSDQMIVRTTDGNAPTGQEELWEKVTSLNNVVNIYDLGLWRSLIAIMQGR